MKNKILEKLGISVCVLSMVLSSFVMANIDNDKFIEPTTVQADEISNGQIQHRYSKVVVDVNIYSDSTSPSSSHSWTQTQGFEWVRVWYTNNSDYTATVRLDNRLPLEVSPHTSKGYLANPVSAGSHKITISSKSGGVIDGWIGVREGEAESDF